MSQTFSKRAELGVKLALLALFVLFGIAFALLVHNETSYEPLGEAVEQPIPFSHKHHVGDDGIDCRYCHTTVETSASAGLPGTSICLSCHSQLYTDQPLLAPLFESAASGKPIPWRRVYQLPDFVFFNHAVHVNKGVACIECHGRIDQMPLTWRVNPLQMQWCLGCHRDPAPHLRAEHEITSMRRSTGLSHEDADLLARTLDIQGRRRMTDCSTCHR